MSVFVAGIIFILLGYFFTAIEVPVFGTLSFLFGVINVLFGLFAIRDEKESKEKWQKLFNIWTEQKSKLSVPSGAVTVDNGRYLLWYEEDKLFWFPASYKVGLKDESLIKLYFAPKENIYYYAQSGELHTEVSGSGGGSAFSVLTGFHGRIKPIKVSTTVHDNRCTQLIYRDGDQDCEFDFAFEDIAVLRRLLPEKDYEVVAKVEAEKQIQQVRPVVQKDEKTKLQKAKELFDAGLITQEEYEKARQKALADLLS